MDQHVCNVLTQAGLAFYIDRFSENRVDSEALCALQDTDINLLIPCIGDRVKFLQALRRWKTLPAFPTEVSASLNGNQVVEQPCSYNQSVVHNSTENSTTFGSNSITQLSVAPVHCPRDHCEEEPIPPIEGTSANSLPNVSLNSSFVDCVLREKEASGTTNNYVWTTLNNNLVGRSIIRNCTNGRLNDKDRKFIVQLILKSYLSSEPNKYVTSNKFREWANDIAQTFNQEHSALYYSGPDPASGILRNRASSGYLYSAYHRIRRDYLNRGLCTYYRQPRRSLGEPQENTNPIPIDLDSLQSDENDGDKKAGAACLLIPCILNTVPSKKLHKVSKFDTINHFILHVVDDSDILPAIEKVRKVLEEKKLTFQPLVVCVGESIQQISKCIVVLDTTHYTFPSLGQAVDVAFKTFFATAAEYPALAHDSWTLIQKAFFNITTRYDYLSLVVKRMLTELGLKDRI